MNIIQTPINEITPYARNPRKNEAAIAKVAASIKEFGFRQPIVVDGEKVVIVGHTRLEAARQLGLADVPVHIATGLTDTQAKAYRLADNRTGEEATWDSELLALELDDLDGEIDLDILGFEPDELDTYRTGSNFAPGTEDDQGRLDQLDPIYVACPDCGHEFDSRKART